MKEVPQASARVTPCPFSVGQRVTSLDHFLRFGAVRSAVRFSETLLDFRQSWSQVLILLRQPTIESVTI